MGAKAWFVAYFDDDPKAVLASGPQLDRNASRELVERLFPDVKFNEDSDGQLAFLNPDNGQVFAGWYPGLRIVAHPDLAIDYPSKIDRRWLDPKLSGSAYVHLTHSVVDWFAFGLWRNGKLVRSLSVSPDNGVLEQIGDPLTFEAPYWAGQQPVEVDQDEEPYPLPFHPLELAEESLLQHLGFQFEGYVEKWVCDPATVPIARFSIESERPRWKFW